MRSSSVRDMGVIGAVTALGLAALVGACGGDDTTASSGGQGGSGPGTTTASATITTGAGVGGGTATSGNTTGSGQTTTTGATTGATTTSGGGPTIAECEAVCTDGQTGGCSSVTGDCGNFCSALFAVVPDAGCAAEADDYFVCVTTPANVCDAMCTTEQDALQSCLTDYCVMNFSNPDCQTLAGSFG